MPFDLSCIIPTYNRRAVLGLVLDALERQSVAADRFEVLVVDDGSPDGTPAWVSQQRRPYALRLLEQKNSGPGVARNTGASVAQGALLLFLDDDLVPEPVLIEEHLRSHQAEGRVAVVGPLGSLPRYSQPWVAWQQAQIEKQYRAMERGDYSPTFRQFWTANCSVEKRDFDAVGGFDKALRRDEDVELGLRLAQSGVGFRFNAKAFGYHHAERTLDSWIRAHSNYGEYEFEIFGRMGDENSHGVLRSIWRGLHPATRLLIRSCGRSRLRGAAASAALERTIGLGVSEPLRKLSHLACSAYANLHYWQAMRRALGEPRFAGITGSSSGSEPSARSRVR